MIFKLRPQTPLPTGARKARRWSRYRRGVAGLVALAVGYLIGRRRATRYYIGVLERLWALDPEPEPTPEWEVEPAGEWREWAATQRQVSESQ